MRGTWLRSLLRFIAVLGAAAFAQSITHTWWQFVIITAVVIPLRLLERRFLPAPQLRPSGAYLFDPRRVSTPPRSNNSR